MSAQPSLHWPRLLAGFALLFAALQGGAALLNSMRGEGGLWVAFAVVTLALLLERGLFNRRKLSECVRALGLEQGDWRGLMWAGVASALMLLTFPIYAAATNSTLSIYPDSVWLAAGIFAQAGVAEEVAFRGYLFAHIRRAHSFWRAAFLSMIPFAIAHLYLFATMDWPIALVALLMAVAVSFPFAHLYELAGRTIWAPALAHAVVQGAIKLIVVEGEAAAAFPLVWMVACTAVLWLLMLVPRPRDD